RTTLPAGVAAEVSILRAQPATRRHYVDLEGVVWGDATAVDAALAGWRARGYPKVEAIEEGTVLGIAGRVIDNREYRIALPVSSAAQASRRVAEVYKRFGTRASARARLAERPWAELSVRVGGAPTGRATSFVRFVATGGSITIDAVEYGAGYSWHGFESRTFHGEIYVVADPDGALAVVNLLGAETVLAGVVPSELFPSSPPEALKAQAIAARNQLLAKLSKRHHDDPFHLCSSQHCQVYGGITKEDPRTTAAVEATTGEAAFLGGRLVDTVYSSTCGGHTEDNDAVWGNAPNPALRGRPDFDAAALPELVTYADGITEENIEAWLTARPQTYCARAPLARPKNFRWKKTLGAADLKRLLAPRFEWIGELQSIEIDARGHGGRVISLRLVGDRNEATIVHELPIRRLFGNLSSGALLIDHHRSSTGRLLGVTFIGGGWGHGVGMCQLGATGRAESGQTYREILAHYYNGSTVEHLYSTPELHVEARGQR
ncbi:MAG: SpoIID/LytB domain-containing protein, partial [Myxococcota bacterium]